MVQLRELISYCDDLLEAERFRDYCPNGLQVEGRTQINKLVSGVTASQALIDAAIEAGADALLVHHGYFWKGEDARVVGLKKQRLAALIKADISLIAYHLPLDAHPVYGNNVQLAEQLGITVEGIHPNGSEPSLLMHGHLSQPVSGQRFARQIAEALGREPLHIDNMMAQEINSLAWCTGAAQGYIEQAVELGVDAYITGEVSEPTVHIARETGIHFFAAGHHATERYGVKALGEHLAENFGLDQQFIDIDNPV
ncbi:MAG: Nif3-like dinuclear metal center hexameric protein [Thioalkalispiraceae bacterium]|jgi:dinuclear metal center YbgI/SA1388 family protein